MFGEIGMSLLFHCKLHFRLWDMFFWSFPWCLATFLPLALFFVPYFVILVASDRWKMVQHGARGGGCHCSISKPWQSVVRGLSLSSWFYGYCFNVSVSAGWCFAFDIFRPYAIVFLWRCSSVVFLVWCFMAQQFMIAFFFGWIMQIHANIIYVEYSIIFRVPGLWPPKNHEQKPPTKAAETHPEWCFANVLPCHPPLEKSEFEINSSESSRNKSVFHRPNTKGKLHTKDKQCFWFESLPEPNQPQKNSRYFILDPSTHGDFEWKHNVAKVVDWMFLWAGGSFMFLRWFCLRCFPARETYLCPINPYHPGQEIGYNVFKKLVWSNVFGEVLVLAKWSHVFKKHLQETCSRDQS